jgi:hypothetical protein
MARLLLYVMLVLLCRPAIALADDIAVAAASDLQFAIKELIVEYEKQTGHHVKLSLGSSGNFFAQLQQGAPFDLYFSADIGYPKKLEEALKKGQIARSPEVQTACVLLGGLAALTFAGREMWASLVSTMVMTLSHLHDTQLTSNSLQAQCVAGSLVLFKCVGPVVGGTLLAGVLARFGLQAFEDGTRFDAPDTSQSTVRHLRQRVLDSALEFRGRGSPKFNVS